MKKTIKLTEKNLTNIVKRVINEQPLDGEIKYVTIEIPEVIVEKAIELGIDESRIEDMFEQYINDSIGTTYNSELEYFTLWAEEQNNLDDFQE